MKPLISIQSIPINVEFKTRNAQLVYKAPPPRANVSRVRGRAFIQTTPARVSIDSFETRASAGIKSAPRSVREFSDAGKAAALEATAQYAEQGNQIVDSNGKGNPMADIVRAKSMNTAETIMAFIPSVQPQIDVEPGSISFDYSMDKLDYSWNINTRPQLEYLPGSVEFTVSQYPKVIIKYIGGPMYVPPSADPDYVPNPALDENV